MERIGDSQYRYPTAGNSGFSTGDFSRVTNATTLNGYSDRAEVGNRIPVKIYLAQANPIRSDWIIEQRELVIDRMKFSYRTRIVLFVLALISYRSVCRRYEGQTW